MMKFDLFKRHFCAKTFEQLASPTPVTGDMVELPFHAVLHCQSSNPEDLGVRGTHPTLRNAKRAWVHHVTELKGDKGRPRPTNQPTTSAINHYFKVAETHIQRGRDLSRSVSQRQAITVLDYTMLPALYRYPASRTEFFDSAENLRTTRYSLIPTEPVERVDVLVMDLPEVLPSFQDLRVVEDEITTSRYEEWEDERKLFFLDLWRSLAQPEHPLRKVGVETLVAWVESDHVAFLHLGDLYAWANEDLKRTRRYLLRFMDTVLSVRTVADTAAIEQANKETGDEDTDEDLEQGTPTNLYQSDTLVGEQTLRRMIEQLGGSGLLSGGEQRRLAKLADSYTKIENPFGDGTLEDLVKPPEAGMTIDSRKQNMRDRPAVLDKSMLSSTINDFDKRYINEVMEKDIASMALSLQNAGVLVKDYKVNRRIDAVNDFTEYKVELVPINGKPSTLTFKLPKVNEEGEFSAAGVKYRMDHQKGD